MLTYDIPVTFSVVASSESNAEQAIWDFLMKYKNESPDWGIADWEFMEFISNEEN